MSLARMPGRYARPWCPYCRTPPGRDCPVRVISKRRTRRALAKELRVDILHSTSRESRA